MGLTWGAPNLPGGALWELAPPNLHWGRLWGAHSSGWGSGDGAVLGSPGSPFTKPNLVRGPCRGGCRKQPPVGLYRNRGGSSPAVRRGWCIAVNV